MRLPRSIRVLLLVALGAGLVWIRTRPLALGVADEAATELVQAQLRATQAAAGAGDPEAAVAAWTAAHPAAYDRLRRVTAARLRADLSLARGDGRTDVYLGDFDSYRWLREARSYLRTGTTCDAIVGGECRDTHTLAPVGTRMRYTRSLHLVAIVGLHRLLAALDPGRPLHASAFWVPVLVGVLSALAAFAIGRRLGGDLAGLVAALAVGFNPIALARGAGSDDDVWQVAMPLVLVWTVLRALAARHNTSRLGWTAAAAAALAAHMVSWSGWSLAWAVVVVGLLGLLLVHGGRALVGRTVARGATGAVALALAAVVGTALVVVALGGADPSSLRGAPTLLEPLLGAPGNAREPGVPPGAWPDAFATVSELVRPSYVEIARAMGGPAVVLGAWAGLLALILPPSGGRWRNAALLVTGTGLCGVILALGDAAAVGASPGGRLAVAAALAAGAAAAVVMRIRAHETPELVPLAGALIVTPWFLGALLLAQGASRFLILLAGPVGLGLGAAAAALAGAAGRTGWLLRQRLAGGRWSTAVPGAVLPVLVALACTTAALVPLLRQGAAVMIRYRPAMNDAWWETLAHLRDTTPADAIVHAWWDYGYWIAYVAERRVTADGSSLRTHVPHWMARALIAPSETETIGLLRMLSCGSDATPEPEGRHGAFGRLVARGVAPGTAYELVGELATRTRDGAQARLRAMGLDEKAVRAVLAATHCTPPAAYLVLSTRQAAMIALGNLGTWDLRRAVVAESLALSEADALRELATRFGDDPAVARQLRRRALREIAFNVEAFVAPPVEYLAGGWIACRPQPDGRLLCPLHELVGPATTLEGFVYAPTDPAGGELRFVDWTLGGTPSHAYTGTPGLVLVATETRLAGTPRPDATHAEVAVLVDPVPARVLVGPERLLRSTLTALLFLDGRSVTRLAKVAERTSALGERVTAWSVRWDAPSAPRAPDH